MFSKTELEGYLEIDHRESPGFTPEEAARAGRGTIPVPKNTRLQSATYNCCGCERMIVKNPLRERERNYCRQCDRYMCDNCSLSLKLTGRHVPYKKMLEEAMNADARRIILP